MSTVYFDEVGEYGLDRAAKLLAGISNGVYRAVGSAVKRAAQHGLTVGMRIVSEEYAISQSELKSRTKNINTVVKDGSGVYSVTFGYRGNVIPLIKFDTKIGVDGRGADPRTSIQCQRNAGSGVCGTDGGHTASTSGRGPNACQSRNCSDPPLSRRFTHGKKPRTR